MRAGQRRCVSLLRSSICRDVTEAASRTPSQPWRSATSVKQVPTHTVLQVFSKGTHCRSLPIFLKNNSTITVNGSKDNCTMTADVESLGIGNCHKDTYKVSQCNSWDPLPPSPRRLNLLVQLVPLCRHPLVNTC